MPTCTNEGCETPYTAFRRRKTTLCKRCAAIEAATSPERNAKVSASMKVKHADPVYREHRRGKLGAGLKAIYADPVRGARMRAWCSENGKRQGGSVAGSDERRRVGRKQTERALGHIPLEYRDDYRRLLGKHFTAAEASAMVLEMVAADQRRYEQTGELQQARRASCASTTGS